MLKKVQFILILSILFIGIFSINTYAAENISLDTFKHSAQSFPPTDYLLFETESGKRSALVFYYDSTTFSISDHAKIIKDSSPVKVKITHHNDDDFYQYALWNYDSTNNKWVAATINRVNVTNTNFTTTVDGQLLASTFDVYFTDGTIFFQPTPAGVPILEKIMEMVPQVAEKIIATLKILVPFGVGLLALLIGLHLLPKILFRFL